MIEKLSSKRGSACETSDEGKDGEAFTDGFAIKPTESALCMHGKREPCGPGHQGRRIAAILNQAGELIFAPCLVSLRSGRQGREREAVQCLSSLVAKSRSMDCMAAVPCHGQPAIWSSRQCQGVRVEAACCRGLVEEQCQLDGGKRHDRQPGMQRDRQWISGKSRQDRPCRGGKRLAAENQLAA